MSAGNTKAAANKRPVFALTLRPQPGVEVIRALRKALKVLLRHYGLRCITIEERRHGQKETTSDSAAPAARSDAQSCPTPRAADRNLGLATKPERPSRPTRKLE